MAIAGKACSVNRLDIICVGSAKYDTNARIARLPLEDERIVTERIVNAAGGNANTAAASAARQGVSVALCTALICVASTFTRRPGSVSSPILAEASRMRCAPL